VKIREIALFFQEILYVEKYTSINSIVHRVDAQPKLVTALLMVVTATVVKGFTPLLLLLFTIITLTIVSKIPLRHLFLRTTLFTLLFALVTSLPFPFLIDGTPLATMSIGQYSVVVTDRGVEALSFFVLKVWVCVASMTIFILTTGVSRLIKAMEGVKVPKNLTVMLAMTYRYIFLLVEEVNRMVLAREARCVRRESRKAILKSLGSILGALFLRSYERGENVYTAMLARGYPGNVKASGRTPWSAQDWLFGLVLGTLCTSALLIDILGIRWL